MKKTSQKFKIDEILKACALFALVLQLCTCVSCEYTRFQPITSAYFFFGYFMTLINTPTGINSAHENCLPSKDGGIKIQFGDRRGGVGWVDLKNSAQAWQLDHFKLIIEE